jgi:hypothetical protein
MINTISDKPKAVFSQTDIPLIKAALLFYKEHSTDAKDEDVLKSIERLYHRLGRI